MLGQCICANLFSDIDPMLGQHYIFLCMAKHSRTTYLQLEIYTFLHTVIFEYSVKPSWGCLDSLLEIYAAQACMV